MDKLLCDELVQEIFQRLPPSPSTSSSVSLVSKRWLYLYRTSKTSLSLRLTSHDSTVPSLSSLLSHYPFLSCLSLVLQPPDPPPTTATAKTTTFSDRLLFLVASFCPKLDSLRFLAGPVSISSLASLSWACTHLTSLCINLSRSRSRPLFLRWVLNFPCLKELSIFICSAKSNNSDDDDDVDDYDYDDYGLYNPDNSDSDFGSDSHFGSRELGLESVCFSGIGAGDWGLGWLWRSCRKLKKLGLRSCEGIGDGGSFSSFAECLQGIEQVELRTCRTIIDGVLMKLAENCDSLTSLLVYDGCSMESLLRFLTENQTHCNNLQKLHLRLPLDLKNDHLLSVAANCRSLSSLKLESCCLVSGEGLKAISREIGVGVEELALVNCDVVERETGLLSTLGQNLRQLRNLDLSYNEMMVDKELTSMLVSLNYLVELRLRGCKGLTDASMFSMFKSCKHLENVDIRGCRGIQAEAIEFFALNSPQLKQLQVEQSKISVVANTWASHKFILH